MTIDGRARVYDCPIPYVAKPIGAEHQIDYSAPVRCVHATAEELQAEQSALREGLIYHQLRIEPRP